MKAFRPHRGTLEEAMKDAIYLETEEEVKKHIVTVLEDTNPIYESQITLSPYSKSDDRIDWKDVHIVLVDFCGDVIPVGFMGEEV